MKQEKDRRRSFLKHILAGSAVVVASAAVVKPTRVKADVGQPVEDEVLYRESEEFSKYYKSLRS